MVELGCFYGESYFGFCQAIQEGRVPARCYAVDTWRGDDHGGHYSDEIFQDVQAWNQQHYSSFSQLIRSTFDEANVSFADCSIDLLHLDGFHSFEAVCHDFRSWLQKVRPGGVVLFHDINVRAPGFGVWKFWDELRGEYPTFSFLHSAGLGVLINRSESEAMEGFAADLVAADDIEQLRIREYYSAAAARLNSAYQLQQLTRKSPGSVIVPIQVFHSSEQSYTEQESAVTTAETGSWQTVVLRLNAGIGPRPLRIDPGDRLGIAEIASVRIRSGDGGAEMWRWESTEPAPDVEVGGTARRIETRTGAITLASDGIDPQLIFPDVCGGAYNAPLVVEVNMRFTPCLTSGDQLAPLGVLTGEEVLSTGALDRAFLREEVRSRLAGIQAGSASTSEQLNAKLSSVLTVLEAGFTTLGSAASQHAAVASQHAAAASQYAVAASQYAAAASQQAQELSELRSHAARLQSELGEMRRAMDVELATLRASLNAEVERRRSLEQSLSWRVTAPARALLGRVSGQAKKSTRD